MAIGIALSDTIYIFITYLGISQLTNSDSFNIWLGGIGGTIMLIFGISSIVKPVPSKGAKRHHELSTKWFKQITKGFLLNGINPFVLFFWISIASKVTLNFQYSTYQATGFFITLIATVFLTDILKAYFSTKLSEIVTPRFTRIMNRVVGIALIAFSLRLFNFVLEGFGYYILGN